jgi:hypothetical protein
VSWKIYESKRSWPNLRYYPGICVEGLRKAIKILSQHSGSPDRDLSVGPPEYVAGIVTTWPRHSDFVLSIKKAYDQQFIKQL